MKKVFLSLLLVAVVLSASAQYVNSSVGQAQLNADVDARDSLEITLTNISTSEDLEIMDVHLFDIYGDQVFSVSPTFFNAIPPQQTATFWLYFDPRHNILHNSELILETRRRGCLPIDLEGESHLADTYYSATYDKKEQELKTALKNTISAGFSSLGYNGARDEMYMVIDNKKVNGQGAAQNELEGVYTGYTVTGYANRTAAQNQGVNTEHTWPQSFFSSNEPMRSDLHHLFITQATANSQRSNLAFGAVQGSPDWQSGGSKRGNNRFEPRDVQKGPTARAMFYFVTRYQNYSDFLNVQETILRQWTEDYPPTAIDLARNDAIENAQGNRNPYVDFPRFLERITSLSETSAEPDNPSLYLPQDTINYYSVKVGEEDQFAFVMMNDGNVDLEITDLVLADPDLFTVSMPIALPIVIEPGDAYTLPLIPNSATTTGGPVSSSLEIVTSTLANPVTVPILADVTLGLDDATVAQTTLQLFPNPAQDEVTIQGQAGQRISIRVLDLQGKLVYASSSAALNHTIQLTEWAAGTYFVLDDRGNKQRLIVSSTGKK